MTNKVKAYIFSDKLVAEVLMHYDPQEKCRLIFFFLFCLNSLKKSALPTRCWATPKRRNFTTDMENKACGKAAGVALEWMTSFPTSLEVDSLDLWVATEVAPGMGVEGEAKTWFTHSSMSSSFSLFPHTYCTSRSLSTSQQGPEAFCKKSGHLLPLYAWSGLQWQL